MVKYAYSLVNHRNALRRINKESRNCVGIQAGYEVEKTDKLTKIKVNSSVSTAEYTDSGTDPNHIKKSAVIGR